MTPGSMDAKMAWLFAIGGGVVGGLLGMFTSGWLGIGLLVAGGFLSTFMTRAGKGLGIGASFVGAVGYALVLGVGGMMMVSGAADEAAAQAGEGAALASAAVSGLGGAAVIIAAVIAAVVGWVLALIAAVVGASVRPKTA